MAGMILFQPFIHLPQSRRLSSRLQRCAEFSAAKTQINATTEQLRSQLDHLHAEAEATRAKANSVRLRLLRLSEAAEKLRRQAAVDVRVGKEEEARELLFQKRKVMKALEKSKSRIEVLDELSTKLNEAISVKETELIGNVASDLEVSPNDPYPVRIVSPKDDTAEHSSEAKVFEPVGMDSDEDKRSVLPEGGEATWDVDDLRGDTEVAPTMGPWKEDEIIKSLKDVSSYEDFLDHLNRQLCKIEKELVTVLRFSSLVMEKDQKQNSSKVQQTLAFLEDVRKINAKIAGIKMSKPQS